MNFEVGKNGIAESGQEARAEGNNRAELRKIVDSVITDKQEDMQEVFKFVFGNEGREKISQEKIDKRIEAWRDGYAESIEVDPRFGTQKDYTDRLEKEVRALSLPEEKKAFLGGLADFRRNSYLKKEINAKIETGDPKKFTRIDDLVMRGELLRTIFDKSVFNLNIEGGLRFAKEYERISGRSVVSSLLADYERMLNEGDAYEGDKLKDFNIVNELKKFGVEATYRYSEERKRNIWSLKEREKGA